MNNNIRINLLHASEEDLRRVFVKFGRRVRRVLLDYDSLLGLVILDSIHGAESEKFAVRSEKWISFRNQLWDVSGDVPVVTDPFERE